MSRLINRRQAIGVAAAVGVASASSPRNGLADDAPAAAVDSIRSISMQPARYHGWPTVAQRKNGELLLVCSGGRQAHVCPFGRVELMRSADQGATWSFPRVIADGPIDDRDAGVVETPSGKALLATTFTSLAYEPILNKNRNRWSASQLARWDGAHNRVSAATRKQALGVWMLRSTDGGVSWSKPYRCLVNSPHGPVGLKDGRMLYAGKALWADNRVGVCHSTDDGATWQWLSEIPTRGGDTKENYHELHAVECASGKLIAQIRNHNAKNTRETLQSHSDDGGKSWSVPRSIGVWGLPSHLLRLADGRLLMSYGYRRKPFGNHARVSDDEGESWSDPLTISADGPGGDLGYPSTVQLADGRLLTIWYEVRPDSAMAVLRQAIWKLS